jgi:pyridoxal phosphate-dependent aminotransferase EpsN
MGNENDTWGMDLYGQSADHDAILEICNHYDVPVIEDAAEALGATYKGRPVGGFGAFGVFSFNGNKIITTSGGGMLVGASQVSIEKARAMASQSRDDAPHYEHSELGFNYRMSNILAAVGRGQLRYLLERVAARRQVFQQYQELLGDLPGLRFMPEAPYGRSTRWLTCVQIEPREFGATREDIRLALESENIESRPVWKPMHLQPLYQDHPIRGGSVAAELFEKGLCLPSGSALEEPQIEKIAHIVRSTSCV